MTPLRGILFFWLSKTYILVKMLWLQLVFASYSLVINWLLTLNLVSCLWHVYKVTQLCLTKQSWDHNSKMYEEKFISPTGTWTKVRWKAPWIWKPVCYQWATLTPYLYAFFVAIVSCFIIAEKCIGP